MIGLTELHWNGREMTKDDRGYTVWVPTPNPVGGEVVSMGTRGMALKEGSETVTHFEVLCTVWGDYCGDACNRSNYRSLLRDYPDTFIEVRGGHFSQYLAIPVGELTGELAEIFVSLVEQYPLYDEDDHSSLEMEELEEQLYSWILSDVRSDLFREYGIDADDLSNEFLTTKFYAYLSEANDYPYLESATGICVPWLNDFVQTLASELETGK